MSDTLDRLSDAAGIQPTFTDYFGNETAVSAATKSALLRAMGYDVTSDVAIAAALGDELDAPWLRALPPVLVVREGDAVEVACALPAALDGTSVEWSIALEGGGRVEGAIAWDVSAFAGEREIAERRYERRMLRIEATLPLGYHRLRVGCDGTDAASALIVAPAQSFVLPAMERDRIWALATQLYALRSQQNWGIGDFGDLAELAALAAQAGAGAIGLNPLHELFPSNPLAASPYAPSSRLFLNAFSIDVGAVPDLADSPQARAHVASSAFVRRLRTLRDAHLVDYAGVAAVKLPVLEMLFAAFRTRLERTGDSRAADFRSFVRTGGIALRRLATYEALAEHFRARDPDCYGWLQWPQKYQSPESPPVARFAAEHRDRVDFYLYLQWLADRQLARAAAVGNARGLGLYRDLAVGVDRNGADAWSDPGSIAVDASLGAPADPLNTQGQNWGLPPLSPRALRERAFAPFVALLRANMRHARILRIDHVMVLRRAFWIPRGRPATDGAYVAYPLQEMLAIVALESVRNQCAIVGEDLGTVPEGFREQLQSARVLSSRLVYFEREADGTFRPPQAYPRLAAASIGTHDLPPLLGWWTAESVDAHARFMLVDALAHARCIDEDNARVLREDAAAGGTMAAGEQLRIAVHRFLALTPSMLAVVAIEDVLGEIGGVNVPGTVDEHPNWRRKRSVPLEALAEDGRLFRIGEIMRETHDRRAGVLR